jgi:hypothetical protein
MKQPSKDVLESIANLKALQLPDFDKLYSWVVDSYNDIEKITLETPKAENVFTHWVALGNLQVLKTILDTIDGVEDKLMRLKVGNR